MEYNNKVIVNFSYKEFGYPLLFMLSLTLLGLECPLGYFFIMAMLFYSFKNNRYDFLIQCTMLFGIYGYYGEEAFPLKLPDLALCISTISLIFYRKNKMIWKILGLTTLYFLFLFFIAKLSDESFSIQIRRLRQYMHIIYFIFPIVVFSQQKFEFEKLFKHLFTYVFIIFIFIILDSLFFSQHILLPRTTWGDLTYTTIQINPFSHFLRIYPAPIFISVLLLYPIIYFYRLPKHFWLIISIGLICTKTISVIGGFIITYFIFSGKLKQKIKLFIVILVGLVIGSAIDNQLGGALRINQLFKQFAIFNQGNEVLENLEDLADFGSGRGAQIIPKLELLTSLDKQMFGFGFLHDKLTTNEEFIINNQYYVDQSKAEEVAALVEVSQIQTILDTGFVGVIVQHMFYLLIYLIIRKCKYSLYYGITLICISIFGIGGFMGLNTYYGLLLLGIVLGGILLINKEENYEIINSNSGI